MAEPSYVIRPLGPTDKVNKLRLRSEDGALSAFLQRSSQAYHATNVAKTYVYVDEHEPTPQKVIGFITILASEISKENGASADDLPDFRYKFYPAVKIARLAVDNKFQRCGLKLGQNLVAYSLAVVKRQIMPHVGCRFMTVDANKPAIDFYRKCGFVLIDTDDNKGLDSPIMFIDLSKVG